MTLPADPVWFITGCSTGFGRELARLVLARGWRPHGLVAAGLEVVYATTDPPLKALRKVIPPLNLGTVRLDLGFMVLLIAVYILRAVTLNLAAAA